MDPIARFEVNVGVEIEANPSRNMVSEKPGTGGQIVILRGVLICRGTKQDYCNAQFWHSRKRECAGRTGRFGDESDADGVKAEPSGLI